VIDAISPANFGSPARSRSVDSRYRQLVDRMFEEIAAKVPGFEVRKTTRKAS